MSGAARATLLRSCPRTRVRTRAHAEIGASAPVRFNARPSAVRRLDVLLRLGGVLVAGNVDNVPVASAGGVLVYITQHGSRWDAVGAPLRARERGREGVSEQRGAGAVARTFRSARTRAEKYRQTTRAPAAMAPTPPPAASRRVFSSRRMSITAARQARHVRALWRAPVRPAVCASAAAAHQLCTSNVGVQTLTFPQSRSTALPASLQAYGDGLVASLRSLALKGRSLSAPLGRVRRVPRPRSFRPSKVLFFLGAPT